ncbi:MAG: hypothetical protein LBC49_01010 [Bacteroidales bacterium]|jgi:hypothetical protein|nr:hypothetical protein [Bacteroidales bacterium]
MKMDKEIQKEFHELFTNEIDIRNKWRDAIDTLSHLIDIATQHNADCVRWFEDNFPDKTTILSISEKRNLIVKKQKKEPAHYEAYLPYGIDFEDVDAIKYNQ